MFGYKPEECCFWGDEFIGVTDHLFGSDAGMITDITCESDFFDVSDIQGTRPAQVQKLGGGISTFSDFLKAQNV